MGVIIFIVVGIAICGICATQSEQAVKDLAERQNVDEAKLKEIRRIKRERKEKLKKRAKKEAIKRANKMKFEAMVLKEMEKILEK